MEAIKTKKFSEAILLCKKQVNSTVVVVDKSTTIKFLDQQSLETLDGFKAKIIHHWYKNNVVDYSYDGSHFAVVSEDARESRLYDARTKKVKIKINRHHGEVTCVAIDPKGNYFFSGGEDGRTYVSDIKSSRLMFTLPTHIDTINDIQFSKRSYLVATASFDKRIQIFNYGTMTEEAKLRVGSPIMKIEFLNDNLLCSVDKSSSIAIWDIKKQKVIKRLTGIHDDIVQVASSDSFLFLGTALGFVLVYSLEDYEQLSRKFINVESKVTLLEYDEEQKLLIVGDESGVLSYYDIFYGIKDIEYFVDNEYYEKAYRLAQKNPLLESTDTYKKLDKIWDELYLKASDLLQNSKKDKALEVFGSFANIPRKKTLIKKLINEYAEFDRFLLMVKNKKLGPAYAMANQHPIFKESKVYKSLEKKWKELFARAQNMAQNPRTIDKAKDILSLYRGISEKTKHIQEMFAKSNIFTRFKNSIIKKDFKIAFELVKVNEFLEEFAEYTALVNFGDKLYISAHKALQKNEIHTAMKILNTLVDFPGFKDEAKAMLKDIEIRDRFYNALENENFVKIYKLIDKSSALCSTPDGMKYEKLWNDDLDVAKVYASNGDILGIDGVIDKYKDIPTKRMAIVSIYTFAYITQIENAIKKDKNKDVIKQAFKNYALFFGLDDYILSTYELFTKKYKDAYIDMETLRKGSKKQWQLSSRVLDILE